MQNPNNETLIFLISTTALILLLAGFIISILYLYQRKQFLFQKNIDDLKINYEKILLQTKFEIQQQTLQNISRDIHDNISLSLTLSKLHLNMLSLPTGVTFDKKIDLAISLISDAIDKLRNIAACLNSDVVKSHGLLNGLQKEVSEIKKTGLYLVEFDVYGDPLFIDPHSELFIFRIIQESLNNILKHARANIIWLRLNYAEQYLHVYIGDNGIGFELAPTNKTVGFGSGLVNIQERTKFLNGTCDIQSSKGAGTRIKISLPIPTTHANIFDNNKKVKYE